jgi:hypothetical protein
MRDAKLCCKFCSSSTSASDARTKVVLAVLSPVLARLSTDPAYIPPCSIATRRVAEKLGELEAKVEMAKSRTATLRGLAGQEWYDPAVSPW